MSLSTYTDPDRRSPAWDPGDPELVRYVTENNQEYALPWHALGMAQLIPRENVMLAHYGPGTFVVTGKGVHDLWEAFCKRKVILIRTDGNDITNVRIELREG